MHIRENLSLSCFDATSLWITNSTYQTNPRNWVHSGQVLNHIHTSFQITEWHNTSNPRTGRMFNMAQFFSSIIKHPPSYNPNPLIINCNWYVPHFLNYPDQVASPTFNGMQLIHMGTSVRPTRPPHLNTPNTQVKLHHNLPHVCISRATTLQSSSIS